MTEKEVIEICPVMNPIIERYLTCDAHEGIYRCQVVGPHSRHRVSQHTIDHAAWGNGYACSAMLVPPERLSIEVIEG